MFTVGGLIMQWIINNKEWIFSGVGLLIVGLICKIVQYFISRHKISDKEIDACKDMLNTIKREKTNLQESLKNNIYEDKYRMQAIYVIPFEKISASAETLKRFRRFKRDAKMVLKYAEMKNAKMLLGKLNKLEIKIKKNV